MTKKTFFHVSNVETIYVNLGQSGYLGDYTIVLELLLLCLCLMITCILEITVDP